MVIQIQSIIQIVHFLCKIYQSIFFQSQIIEHHVTYKNTYYTQNNNKKEIHHAILWTEYQLLLLYMNLLYIFCTIDSNVSFKARCRFAYCSD